MGFNMPKDRIVNIVNISAYFVCVLYMLLKELVYLVYVVGRDRICC